MMYPFERNLLSEVLEDAVRIDRYPAHRVFYHLGVRAGDVALHLFLVEIEGKTVFWKEMDAGQTVRFRFPAERKDYYPRFPLQGFQDVLERATRLCGLPAAAGDRAYFEK